MPLDSSIALNARPMDLGQVADSTLTGFQVGQQAALNRDRNIRENKISDEKIKQIKLNRLDKREQSRIKSVITGASVLDGFLESGDLNRAKSFLTQRRDNLLRREALGESIDTSDTDEALELLESNPEQLRSNVKSLVSSGQQLGMLKSTSAKEGFTLKEGEKRFDAKGNLVAEGKFTPKTREEALDLTPGEEGLDKAFVKELSDFQAGGGFADADKQIEQLKLVRTRISESINNRKKKKSFENLSDPRYGFIPDKLLAFGVPEAIEVKEQVEEVVQRNLKLILGGQFSEKEGENLIRRAYNESLDETVNFDRVNRLVEQMHVALQTKREAANYFNENGTLKGWKGSLPTHEDFENAISDKDSKEKELDFNKLK